MEFRLPFVFLIAAASSAAASDVRVVEQIVAKINGDIITQSELARSRRELETALRQQGLGGMRLEQELKEREKYILRDRIDSLLAVQKAKELEIKVDGDLTRMFADFQRQAKIADTDEFHEFVRRQVGMPFEDYRERMRDELLTRRLIEQEVSYRINVPRAEIQKYYDEHKEEFIREERVFLREILLSTVGKSESEIAEIEKKANDLADRARKGERFAELARDNSDADTAASGGELPPLRRAELDRAIADIVFAQEKGFVTDPIRRPNGFLILRVEEKHAAGQASLEEVESEIQNKLYAPRYEAALRPYLTKLRQEAFIEIRDGYVDAGAAPGQDTSWKGPAQLRPQTVSKEEVASQAYRPRLLWLVPMWYTKKPAPVSSSQ